MSPKEKLLPSLMRVPNPIIPRPPTKAEKDLGRLPDPWQWEKDLDGRWAARMEVDGKIVSVHDGADPPDGWLAITTRPRGQHIQPAAPMEVFLEVARANGYL